MGKARTGGAKSPAGKTSGDGPAPAYAVFGKEPFLRRQAVAEIIDRVLGDADPTLGLCAYDGGESVELAGVLDDLRTLPFLTPRRLVVVRDADSFISQHRDKLEDYLDKPSPTGVLLLEGKSLPANTRLYKRIKAVGEVVVCDPIKPQAMAGWLTERARSAYGVKLDPQAAALLRELVGDEMGLLDSELLKLSLYVGERRQIAVADVHALTGQSREEQIWGIMNAIAERDAGKALSLWENVWETDRAAPARAVAGLAFKVRQILNARALAESGASSQEVSRALMVWNDRDRDRMLRAFPARQTEDMLTRLMEADLASKSGGVSVRTSIETMIVEQCGRAGR